MGFLKANKNDLSCVEIEAVDRDGILVSIARNLIQIPISGNGKLTIERNVSQTKT